MNFSSAMVFVFFGTLLGTATSAFAQHDGKEDDKQGKSDRAPAHQQGKNAEQQASPRPAPQQASQQPQHQEQPKQPPQRAEQPKQLPQRAEQPKQPPQRTEQAKQPPQRAEQPQTPTQRKGAPAPAQQQRPQLAKEQVQPQRSQQQAQAWQQKRGWQQPGAWQGHDTWQADRAGRWSDEHRTWAQRGGYGGFYITQDQFRVSFGNEHMFRLQVRPVIYQGYPRFEYGGYSFLLLDPWPEYWSDNWYAADDLYIDYDDGYYLHNRNYSQVRLAITVAL